MIDILIGIFAAIGLFTVIGTGVAGLILLGKKYIPSWTETLIPEPGEEGD